VTLFDANVFGCRRRVVKSNVELFIFCMRLSRGCWERGALLRFYLFLGALWMGMRSAPYVAGRSSVLD